MTNNHPKTAAFIAELRYVYQKHQMSLAADADGFTLVPLRDAAADRLDDAYISDELLLKL